MPRIKIQNIQFAPYGAASSCPELFYRSQGQIVGADDGTFKLAGGTEYDFCTYFNMLSLAKWKQYTYVEEITLCMNACGSFTLQFFDMGKEEPGALSPLGQAIDVELKEPSLFTAQLPPTSAPCVAFTLTTQTECSLDAGWYESPIEDCHVQDVRISVVMTTFNNEKYLLPNIGLFNDLLRSDDPIADALDVHIIDNGRSLDSTKLEVRHLTVHPNDNAGGAGGAARGLIETLKREPQASHVLLMDDDVSVSIESIKRSFALLRVRKVEYKNLCISGAMLKLEQPSILHEDVGYVQRSGFYAPLKPSFDFSSLADVIASEAIPTDVPNAYGAWWYFCLPITLIRQYGLPLPLFVRCDDIEYGMRLKPTIATMNGICVWHASFEGRARASIEDYQNMRNFFIANAIHGMTSGQLFMLRFKRKFRQEASTFAYGSAELLLDALEDYLKGPEFIKNANGAELMKVNALKNERLIPITEIEAQIGCPLQTLFQPSDGSSEQRATLSVDRLLKFVSSFMNNPHTLPESMLLPDPVIVSYDGQSLLGNQTRKASRLIALNAAEGTGIIRQIDRAHYANLIRRYRELMKRYRKEKGRVAYAYREAAAELGSIAFWESYLSLAIPKAS